MEPTNEPSFVSQLPTWAPPTAPGYRPPLAGPPTQHDHDVDPPSAAAPNKKRVLWIAAGVAAALIVVGLGAWGLSQRNRANDWRQEADELSTERDGLNDEVASLTDELDSVASEKARVTDEREALRQLVEMGPVVAAAMSDCADANGVVAIEAIELIQTFPYGSIYPLEAAVDDSTTKCDQARTMLATFNTTVDGLAP